MRKVKFRDSYAFIYLIILLIVASVFICQKVFAAGYNQNDQTSKVLYAITDSSGNPVTGQTVRLAVQRVSDGYFRDFSDGTFKASGWTTRLATMSYDTTGEYYGYDLQVSAGNLVSGDYVCIVSNDDTVYGDQQAEVIKFDNLAKLIRIQR